MAFTNISTRDAFWQAQGLRHLLAAWDLQDFFTLPALNQVKKTEQSINEKKRDAHFNFRNVRENNASASAPTAKINERKSGIHKQVPVALTGVWAELLRKTRPGRVAWTYSQLGADLLDSSQSSRQISNSAPETTLAQRRNLLKKFLQTLGHPSGTHTFWPYHLPANIYNTDSGIPANELDFFWSGIAHLGCRYLIILGAESANALFPKQPMEAKMKFFRHGVMIYFIWDIEYMLKDKNIFESAVDFLKIEFNSLF